MGEILKNHGDLPEAIDFTLDDLKNNIEALHGKFYSFEKQGDTYYMVVGGHKLDTPFSSPHELLSAMKMVSSMLRLYHESGYEGNLYIKEDLLTRGDTTEGSSMSIYVDNRPVFDTKFLSSQGIEKLLGVRTSRDNKNQLEKFANFLNLALSVQKYGGDSSIRYAQQ